MNVLGVSCYYHDSSACLIVDGKLVAAAEEERFTRKKHDTSFPHNAIHYCLEEAGLKINEIDHLAFYEKPLVKFERLLAQHIQMYPRSFWSFFKAMPSWINEKLRVMRPIRKKLGYKGDVLFVEHHLAHAASSFLVSPFKKAAFLTIDGVGEWSTTTFGIAEGNDINILKEITFPDSVGLLYSTATAHLGFSVNNSEYKVMGLAPYGKPVYLDKFRKVMDVKEDGSFRMDMDYFDYHYKMTMPSEKWIKLFGPVRKGESEVTQHHKDLAASLQAFTEEIVFKILNHVHKVTKCDNLVMAGGVALNSVANGKILSKTPFKKLFIIPAAGDGGTSVGAAAYVYHTLLKQPRTHTLNDAYLGPGFSNKYVEDFLKKNKIKYRKFKNRDDKIKTSAKLVADDNVIGWFQGRMEFGPRALGSRSILSNATNPNMQEILNLKVKHREKFRPFAPVVCEDDAKDYFECDNPVPIPTDYMLMVYPIKKSKQKLIPSVTHVDGSGRLQTIRRTQNPDYYDVIKHFGKLTKIPILINTSFNIRGEPIVCRPEHAYRCMMGTGIDYLVLNDYLIAREDNPQDMWDSEALAKD